jgi:hypothetical protein
VLKQVMRFVDICCHFNRRDENRFHLIYLFVTYIMTFNRSSYIMSNYRMIVAR